MGGIKKLKYESKFICRFRWFALGHLEDQPSSKTKVLGSNRVSNIFFLLVSKVRNFLCYITRNIPLKLCKSNYRPERLNMMGVQVSNMNEAQLVEQRSIKTEVLGSNPNESIFFLII